MVHVGALSKIVISVCPAYSTNEAIQDLQNVLVRDGEQQGSVSCIQ